VLIVDGYITVNDTYQTGVKKSISLDLNESIEKKREKIKAISPKVLTKLTSFLNKRFENSTVKIMSVSDIDLLYPNIKIHENNEAFVSLGNNTIVLIKERTTLETMLHEMSHLYLANLKDKDLKLYETIMQKMESDPILDQINRAYSKENNYNRMDILEEAFVYKLQKLYSKDFTNQFLLEKPELFDGLLDDSGDYLGSMTTVYTELFEDFFNGKLKKNMKIDMNDSLMVIMQKIGADMIFSKNSSLKSMHRKDKANLKAILTNKSMTKLDAVKQSIREGLIQKICK